MSAPFVFISYAHADSAAVLPIIETMKKSGIRLWYDDGIVAGSEWPEFIANKVNSCTRFVSFISNAYVASQNCKRELNFAVSREKELLSVYLEDVTLSLGLEMQLGTYQAIFRKRFASDEQMADSLCMEAFFDNCREDTPALKPAHAPTPAPVPESEAVTSMPTEDAPTTLKKPLPGFLKIGLFLMAGQTACPFITQVAEDPMPGVFIMFCFLTASVLYSFSLLFANSNITPLNNAAAIANAVLSITHALYYYGQTDVFSIAVAAVATAVVHLPLLLLLWFKGRTTSFSQPTPCVKPILILSAYAVTIAEYIVLLSPGMYERIYDMSNPPIISGNAIFSRYFSLVTAHNSMTDILVAGAVLGVLLSLVAVLVRLLSDNSKNMPIVGIILPFIAMSLIGYHSNSFLNTTSVTESHSYTHDIYILFPVAMFLGTCLVGLTIALRFIKPKAT